MYAARAWMVSRIMIVSVLAAACADARITDPPLDEGAPGLRFSKGTEPVLPALELQPPRKNALHASAWIDARGGAVQVGEVLLTFPAGALNSRVEVTVTLPAGAYAVVDLQPHGLQFRKAVWVGYGLAGTVAERNAALAGNLVGVYTEAVLNSGWVTAQELSLGYVTDGVFTFPIQHFSRYVVAPLIMVGG